MAADNVDSVITLALEVADTCRGLPDTFSPGATVAYALVSTLRDFQIYSSTQSVQIITLGSSDASLTAHLAPCSTALKEMRKIQQRHGQKGIKTRFKTNSDKEKFDKETSALNEAVQRLREMVQALRQGAVTPYTETDGRYQPEHSASQASQGSQASQASQASHVTQESQVWQASQASQNTPSPAQPISIVIVNQPQHHNSQPHAPRAQPATSRPSYYSPSAKPKLPMCQAGSGCRAPLCHKSFAHPEAPTCSMGRNCSVAGCLNWHPKSSLCPNGANCPWETNGCIKAHPWPRQPSPPPSRSGRPRASQASVSELSEENSSRRPSAGANVNSPGLVSSKSFHRTYLRYHVPDNAMLTRLSCSGFKPQYRKRKPRRRPNCLFRRQSSTPLVSLEIWMPRRV